MAKEITLEEARKLVEFEFVDGSWRVRHVKSSIYGAVCGDVGGNVGGSVRGYVGGDVYGNVHGNVHGSVNGHVGGYVFGSVRGYVGGTINGREWQYVETPKDKLKRLLDEGADKEQLLEAFNQLEEN